MTKHEKNQRRNQRKNKKLSRMASYSEQPNKGYNFELIHSSTPKGISFGEPTMKNNNLVQTHYQAVKPLLNTVREETILNQQTTESNNMSHANQETTETPVNSETITSSESPTLWTALAVGAVVGGLAGGIGKGLEGTIKGVVAGAGASAVTNHFLDTEYKYVAMLTSSLFAGGLTRLTPSVCSVKMGLTQEESESLVKEINSEQAVVISASDDTL